MEDRIIISDNKDVTNKLNKFFIDSVENLDLEPFLPHQYKNSGDDIEIIHKYSLHPSVLKIREVMKPDYQFEFTNVTAEKLEMIFLN